MVLAAERDGTDGTFDRVVIEFDVAVDEEAAKGVPTVQRIPDRVGNAATRWVCLPKTSSAGFAVEKRIGP